MKALELIFKNASGIHGFSELQLTISKDKLDVAIAEAWRFTKWKQIISKNFRKNEWRDDWVEKRKSRFKK